MLAGAAGRNRASKQPWGTLAAVLLFFCLLPGVVQTARAQERAGAEFRVFTAERMPLPSAIIRLEPGPETGSAVVQTRTNAQGEARLQVAPGNYQALVTASGYDTLRRSLEIKLGKRNRHSFSLVSISTDTIDVNSGGPTNLPEMERPFSETMSIDPSEVERMADPNSSIERVIGMLAGGTTSEFTSQYRIRGGNFDENLVYINGVEIYRPQLIRAGWQEGLPITNSNLAGRVQYSAGGFQARYGDKMSSVLDIGYRQPTQWAGSMEIGLLTQNLTLEGVVQKKQPETPTRRDSLRPHFKPGKLTVLAGARRMSFAYLLNALDTDGEYEPSSYDFQLQLSYTPPTNRAPYSIRYNEDATADTIYNPAEPLRITGMHILSSNNYRFRPESRETTFGSLQQAFRLFVAFIGEEQLQYLTNQSALVIDHQPSLRLKLKYIATYYRSDEDELFDTEGGYRLGDVNTSLGGDEFNEIVFLRGVGTELRRARNFLTQQVAYGAVQGQWRMDKDFYQKAADDFTRHTLWFGLRAQQEWIDDRIKEWQAVDSAGYIERTDFLESQNSLESTRAMGYLQYGYRPHQSWQFILGGRAQYWTLNEELILSPRLQMAWSPVVARGTPKERQPLQLRAAAGYYYQPPFYRELRNLDAELNTQRLAQQSIHLILGGDYVFQLWDRPFKLYTEFYYKELANLVPYEYENVRLRYYSTETARGYAYGADAKINGQFIDGVDSWFRVSYLKTEEEIESLDQGLVRRPSDQRATITLFFQDHLPRLKTFKAHINVVYGTGLPFGPPGVLENRTAFQQPHYSRVDIGLSYLLSFRTREERKRPLSLRSLWISMEVFNLFQRANTVSYTWVDDVYGNQFAVPNYLSSRLLNLRVIAKF